MSDSKRLYVGRRISTDATDATNDLHIGLHQGCLSLDWATARRAPTTYVPPRDALHPPAKPKDLPAMPTAQEINEGPQTVSFQIAHGNARQSCILQTKLPTKEQAQKYLLTNWPTIEKMARDALASGNLEDGQIKLVMI